MSGTRKLQQEIDRTFKQIQEGLEKFQAMWDRCEAAEGSVKEKAETELKKEIKKLQRHRDVVRGWMTNNDVKNKKPLQEYRRLIEVEMERFKVLEKETKMKAYSKEGLSAALRQSGAKDSQSSPDFPFIEWLNETVEKFREEIENIENEVDELQEDTGKPSKMVSTQISELNDWREQCQFHLENLESAYDKLQSDEIVREQVEEIQDGANYFLDCYREPDFMDDEHLYDVLDETPEEVESRREAREDYVKAEPTPPDSPVVAPAPAPAPAPTPAPVPTPTSSQTGANTRGSKSTPVSLAPTPSKLVKTTASVPATNMWASNTTAAQVIQGQQQPTSTPAPAPAPAPTPVAVARSTSTLTAPPGLASPISPPNPMPRAMPPHADPAIQTVLAQGAASMLPQGSASFLPPFVSVTPRVGPTSWRQGYRQVPTTPLLQRMSSIGAQQPPVMSKLSLDALRFICNAQQGTTVHYLAARELKRRQWRFHTGMGVWVHRESDIQVAEASETGVMMLADPNNFTQKKTEFTFQYAYLETDVMPQPHRE